MPKPIIIQQDLEFPVYGISFNSEDVLFVGGGGGANRSGVSFELKGDCLTQLNSLNLSEKEDCPMSIACHPQLPLLAVEYLMLQTSKDYSVKKLNTKKEKSKDVAEYQKVTRYSRSGNYLVTAFSDGRVSILNTKNGTLLFPSFQFKDVQDVDFDAKEEYVVIATLKEVTVISLQEKGIIVQVIDSPRLNRQSVCQIRAVRYATFEGQETLYAIINSTSKGHAFICAWKLSQQRKYPVTKPKTVGICRKNVTCFSVSPVGDLLAFASNDLSVSLLDAQKYKPLLKVNQIHGFAITDLTFNHSGKYLATAGADNLCKVIRLDINKKLDMREIFYRVIYGILSILLFVLLMHLTGQIFGQFESHPNIKDDLHYFY
ncbi:hypothetical protein CU098_012542 [Rhizopus stolonifer]|uniref:Uncharacterized protein n=1 Tax=Rhizopus stolonifer TaxID=4846 RepID=A0A367KVJ4_RHIST|nr:hypothetical protein CU098_012542 [Rhizopus stolonifer]